jgi:hypothetical protein
MISQFYGAPLAELEIVLRDFEFLELGLKSRRRDLKFGRSTFGTRNSAPAFCECGLDDLPFGTRVSIGVSRP